MKNKKNKLNLKINVLMTNKNIQNNIKLWNNSSKNFNKKLLQISNNQKI